MDNNNKFTLALKTLDELRDHLKRESEASIKLKQWTISVWIGILAVISTGKLSITLEQVFFLPYVPIFLFFFLDIFQGALISQLSKKVYTIEKLLATKHLDDIVVEEIVLFNYTNFLTWFEKIKLYLRMMFIPHKFLFYLLLTLTTVVFNSLHS